MLGALVQQLAPQYFTEESFLDSPMTLRYKEININAAEVTLGKWLLEGLRCEYPVFDGVYKVLGILATMVKGDA